MRVLDKVGTDVVDLNDVGARGRGAISRNILCAERQGVPPGGEPVTVDSSGPVQRPRNVRQSSAQGASPVHEQKRPRRFGNRETDRHVVLSTVVVGGEDGRPNTR